MQQAELLSSLAVKVNNEKTDQSLDSAWMVSYKSLDINLLSNDIEMMSKFYILTAEKANLWSPKMIISLFPP